jgi:hypothetical protein
VGFIKYSFASQLGESMRIKGLSSKFSVYKEPLGGKRWGRIPMA